MLRRGRPDIGHVTGRVVPVVALTGTAAPVARALAAGIAAALARLPGAAAELLVIPGTSAPPARGIPVRVGGLSTVPGREAGARLVVCGLPPRDLPRLRVCCPDCVAVLVVPPSLPAAQAALRLLDQSASWTRRTVLVPQLPAPAMARAVLHVGAGAAAGCVPLVGRARPQRLRRIAADLARIVLTLPAPAWPGQHPTPTPIRTLEEEPFPCTA